MDKKLSQTGLSLLALVQPCLTRNILGHPSMATDPINKPTNFHTIYYFISPYISIVPPTVLSSNSTPLCELYAPPSRICPGSNRVGPRQLHSKLVAMRRSRVHLQ